MHHPWFQWWAFCFQRGTTFFYFDYRHTKLLNFHTSCWLYFLHFFQWRKPSLREVMLTWSRAHNLSKKELGLQPQSSDTKGQYLSPVYFCHLKPIPHYPTQAVTGREYHWGLLLWQLFLSSYQVSPPTFVLRVEAGPVHLPTSLFLRTIDLGIPVQTSVWQNLSPVNHVLTISGWVFFFLFLFLFFP